MPAVSVIVPVYNAQAYLRQCMDALVSQSLKSLEIIAVNDGSTDDSLPILEKYQAADPRIRIISQPNAGYGAAMNHGIAEATGEYIGIVEPDDFPERSMFKRLHRLAQKHDADLVKCNHYNYYDGHNEAIDNYSMVPYGKLFDPRDFPQVISSRPAIWAALYRKSMLDENEIRFMETPGASFQDTSFVMKSWFAARRCAITKRHLLHYRMDNPNSSSQGSAKIFEVCDELAEAERFLRSDRMALEAFLAWFQADKWGKYNWNYQRINDEGKLPFVQRVRDEYIAAVAEGSLDRSLFDEKSGVAIDDLLSLEPAQFVEKHPREFWSE